MFAILKQSMSNILLQSVKAAQTISFIMSINGKMLYTKYPSRAESKLIMVRIAIVFKNSKLARFRFVSIDMFIIDETTDIKKYPKIREYVPRYLGKKIMHNIRIAEDTI